MESLLDRQLTQDRVGGALVRRFDDLDQAAMICCRGLMAMSVPPQVLDLAISHDAMALRFAELGAFVTAINQQDLVQDESPIDNLDRREGDLFENLLVTEDQKYHMCLFQRGLQFFSHEEAAELLTQMHRVLKRRARLYISVGSTNSPLAKGYPVYLPIEYRHSELATPMAVKYGIRHPVTLYSVSELCSLLNQSGYEIESAWVSDAGDVKCCAVRR